MGTDAMELLPQQSHLLYGNFSELGEGSTLNRQYWIACMKLALQALGRKRCQDDIENVPPDNGRTSKHFRIYCTKGLAVDLSYDQYHPI